LIEHVPSEEQAHEIAEEYGQSPILPQDPYNTHSAPSDTDKATSSIGSIIIVAVVFLVVGVLLGMNLGGDRIDEATLRSVVRDTMNTEMAIVLEGIIANNAVLSTSGAAPLDTAALQDLIAAAIQDANRQERLLLGDDPYLGPEDAPVVIVEFSDFLCPFCGRHFQETLGPLMNNYDGLIRYVYRDFPSVGGQNAVEAGMAAHCADDQGAFWEYHGLLFANQDSLRADSLNALRDVLISHAESLELEITTFAECLDSDKYLADIMQDASEGQQYGVRGTPGFFINGTFVSGAQPYEIFANIVEAELAAAGIDPDQGT
jgi:protein-disulfide isomerase